MMRMTWSEIARATAGCTSRTVRLPLAMPLDLTLPTAAEGGADWSGDLAGAWTKLSNARCRSRSGKHCCNAQLQPHSFNLPAEATAEAKSLSAPCITPLCPHTLATARAKACRARHTQTLA